MVPPSPLLAVPNVTAHPSTASVQITALLYDGPLLCGFNVATKGLTYSSHHLNILISECGICAVVTPLTKVVEQISDSR